MNLSWLQSAMMGFVSGLSEPLPMSPEAHRGLLRVFMGAESEGPLFTLMCHIAVLVVVLMTGRLELGRLRRTSKLLKTPPRRRTGQPDLNSAGTLKLLRSAALLAVIGRMLSVHLSAIADKLYLLFPALIAGGLLLWLPTQFKTANKDGRHLAPTDGMLMGLGAAASAIPGISLVGASAAIGSMGGVERRYAIRFSWILLVISLGAAVVIDLLAIAGTGFSFELTALLKAVLGGACAAGGAYLGVQLMLSMLRRGGNGLSGFCYYNWGMALLCLVLFLLV